MAKKTERKTFYFADELNDDFAGNNIKTRHISSDYVYDTKNVLLKILYSIIRVVFTPLFCLIAWIIYHPKIKNKKVLKTVKRKGYYMFSNHVLSLDPLVPALTFNVAKYCGIASGADAFSIHPIVTFLIKCLGAFPIPNLGDSKMYKGYTEHMSKLIKRKKRVLIYPEAHIWPFYNKIRPFVSSPFKYPVMDNAPVIVLTTTFKQRGNKKPYPTVYIDGPFYPDLTIEDEVKRKQALRDIAYETMNKRVAETNSYAFHTYIKKEQA